MSKPHFSNGRPVRPAIQPTDMEIDLHGMVVSVAMERTRRHIDRAYNARLHIVKIIHGHGTGALKSAVHELLSSTPLVKKFYPGSYGDGGHGVTIAELNYGQTGNYDSPLNYRITPKPQRRR